MADTKPDHDPGRMNDRGYHDGREDKYNPPSPWTTCPDYDKGYREGKEDLERNDK